MSSIDLFLLGLLMNKPYSAYDIAREIEFRNMREWAKISEPTVYKNLLKLHLNGFTDATHVKEGEMPEKRVYEINEKGKERFFELIAIYAQDPGNFYFDFNLAIANFDKLPAGHAVAYLKKLQAAFRERRRNVEEKEIPARMSLPLPARMILTQHLLLNRVMEDWTGQYIDILEEEQR